MIEEIVRHVQEAIHHIQHIVSKEPAATGVTTLGAAAATASWLDYVGDVLGITVMLMCIVMYWFLIMKYKLEGELLEKQISDESSDTEN